MTDLNVDAATLRRMYVDEGMTVVAIAQALRVRTKSVCDALAQWDIPRRRRGPRRSLPDVPLTPGQLRMLVKARGVRVVARDLGVAPDVLYVRMGIAPAARNHRRVLDDDVVWAAYQTGAPTADLMVRFQCSRDTLKRSLRRAFLHAKQREGGKQ